MKIVCSIAIAFVISSNLLAQESTEADQLYRSMVFEAAAGYSIDFNELRLTYSKTSYFEPFYDVREEFKTIINEEQWDEAKTKLGQLMWVGAFSLVDFSHIAVTIFDALGEKANSDFFKYIGEELLKTIYNSGNGLSADTAWQVINIREEYFLLNSLNYRVLSHKNYQSNSQYFDELEAEDLLTGNKTTFYFNTSLMNK